MSQLCFVTSCMGRLSFLQQTLGCMASQSDCSCVVVDYSCPDHAGDWVTAHYPQVRVVRRPGETVFNLAAARNAGAGVADAPWICFTDADILLESNFAETVLPLLQPGCFFRADSTAPGLAGTLICARADFERSGGYDEVIQGWGEEDNDFCDALQFAGLTAKHFPASLLQHLPHADEARVQFHAIRSIGLNYAINRVYRFLKWDLVRLAQSLLSVETRRSLYQAVVQKVTHAAQTGQEAELDVQFAFFEIPGKWRLNRVLSYKLRPESGS